MVLNPSEIEKFETEIAELKNALGPVGLGTKEGDSPKRRHWRFTMESKINSMEQKLNELKTGKVDEITPKDRELETRIINLQDRLSQGISQEDKKPFFV